MLGCVGIIINSYLDIKDVNFKFKSFILSFVLTLVTITGLIFFNIVGNFDVLNIKDIIFTVSFFFATFFVIFMQSKLSNKLCDYNFSKSKTIVLSVILAFVCCIINLALIVNIGIIVGVVLNWVFGVSLSLLV